MAVGDRVAHAGQLQINSDESASMGGVLIDAHGLERSSADATTNGEQDFDGFGIPTQIRNTDTPRVADGDHAGLRTYGSRKFTIPLLNFSTAGQAKVLREAYPPNPGKRRDIVFQGFGWPEDEKFRIGGRVADGGHAPYTRSAGISDDWVPTIAVDCADPLVYEDTVKTHTMATNATWTAVDEGTFDSRRLTLTMFGPWVHPGLFLADFPTFGLWFDLTLEDGQGIFVQCDEHGSWGLGSFEIPRDDLWAAAKSPADHTMPWQEFPVMPGGGADLVTTGTGSGHVDLAWRPAHLTPKVAS